MNTFGTGKRDRTYSSTVEDEHGMYQLTGGSLPDVRATVDEFYGGRLGTKWTDAEALQERCNNATTRGRESSKADLDTEEPEDPETIGNLDPAEDMGWNRDCRTTGTTVYW